MMTTTMMMHMLLVTILRHPSRGRAVSLVMVTGLEMWGEMMTRKFMGENGVGVNGKVQS